MSLTNSKENLNSSFVIGEKILCEQKVLIYSAKILKQSVKDGQTKFLVHYDGWSKTHDEWVTIDRMLKRTEDNLKLQEEILNNFKKSSSTKVVLGNGIKLQKDLKSPSGVDNKRLDNTSTETEFTKSSPTEDKSVGSKSDRPSCFDKKKVSLLNIPIIFYSFIVDENIYINQDKMLYKLPSEHTVEKIVEEYKKKCKANVSAEICKQLNTSIDGLKEVFNTCLGSRLLHKFERHQYSDVLAEHPQKAASQIYGAPHLIRFLGYMDEVLQNNNGFTVQKMECLRKDCQSMIDFIAANFKMFIKEEDYYNAPPEYLRRSR